MNDTTTIKTKKEYRVCAMLSIPCYLTLEADDEEHARELAYNADPLDFISDDDIFAREWEIQHDVVCLTDQ